MNVITTEPTDEPTVAPENLMEINYVGESLEGVEYEAVMNGSTLGTVYMLTPSTHVVFIIRCYPSVGDSIKQALEATMNPQFLPEYRKSEWHRSGGHGINAYGPGTETYSIALDGVY